MTIPRLKFFLPPPINAMHRDRQTAYTYRQVFSNIEPCLLASQGRKNFVVEATCRLQYFGQKQRYRNCL